MSLSKNLNLYLLLLNIDFTILFTKLIQFNLFKFFLTLLFRKWTFTY